MTPPEIDLGYHGDVVVFDLDDTLYPERDFMLSGFRAVAGVAGADIATGAELMAEAYDRGSNAMDALADFIGIGAAARETAIAEWVKVYRGHRPEIALDEDTLQTLERLRERGIALAVITDGRGLTQRNKLEALGLYRFFSPDNIYISEERGHDKMSMEPFGYMVHRYPEARRFMYVGDNPAKDFINPNLMGWTTVCLRDKGRNIHSQTNLPGAEYAPQRYVDSLGEILEDV